MENKKAKQRKKRMKRQPQIRIKEVKRIEVTPVIPILKDDEKPWLNPVIPVTVAEPFDRKRWELYVGKYRLENKEYQSQLDAIYSGTVTPIEKYVNPHSSISHHCSECHKEWYAKSLWLLTKKDQKHICGVDPFRQLKKSRLK
ncbi:hypothetical protein COK28_07120 [Bacillus cereus]|nr:hypothetical protein COK28_07120 [Bacillus cereus]